MLHFRLVTPERVMLEQELTSLSCPTKLGEITILPHHTPLVAELVPGELTARTAKGKPYMHVAGGFIEVFPDSTVVALADAAEHHYEIDLALAEQARERAKTALAEAHVSDTAYAQAAASLERSLARIKIARKHAHRRNKPITSEGVFSE